MNIERTVLCLLTGASLVLSVGCKEKTPTEKAIDAVKDSVKKVGESAEMAYDKTKDAVKSGTQAVSDGVKKGVEKTGEAIDKAGEQIKELGK